MKRKSIVTIMIVLVVAIASTISYANNDRFVLAPKEKLKEFYKSQGKEFYDDIPLNIKEKHNKTLEKIDKMLQNEKGAISSKDENFDLYYYEKIIRVGIVPYVQDDKETLKEIKSLLGDIKKYTQNTNVDSKKLERKPTVIGDVKDEDLVRVQLNANNYSASAAVDYAKLWTVNGQVTRNSAYDYYAGMYDCTNFVSQCLHDSNAGGIAYDRTDLPGADKTYTQNWYYADGFLNPPSYTWGAVENLYDHLDGYGSNVRRLYYYSQCVEGDIIQWDLDGDSTVLEHSTIITKIDTNGDIFLTYHSTDKEDEPITTFFNSGYTGYAWAIDH